MTDISEIMITNLRKWVDGVHHSYDGEYISQSKTDIATLLAYIDSQSDRIDDLEKALREITRCSFNHKERAESAEKELAALRDQKPIGSFHIADQEVEATTDYLKKGEWPIDNGELVVYARPVTPTLAAIRLPDVEKWRPVDQVRAQQAYRVLVKKAIKDDGGEVVE